MPATANPTRPQGRAAFFGEAAMFTAQLVGPTDEPPGVNAASARRGRDKRGGIYGPFAVPGAPLLSARVALFIGKAFRNLKTTDG